MKDLSDTIVALSTPPGRSALAVVRLSGSSVTEVLKKIAPSVDFTGNARKAVLARFQDLSGDEIDTGIVVFYKSPESYTGEDTAEFSLHGNPVIVKRFIAACLQFEKVRPADPGEFTLRAYLNGKMDLAQAESVRRIIEAKTEHELESSRRILSGELSRELARFRSHLLNLKAEAEAETDFSGEDLTYRSREERKKTAEELINRIKYLTESSQRAMRNLSNFRIVLAGPPNAGKSSLLNRLIGWDRALVSEIAGTTRDYITEDTEIEGIPVRLTDTAGIRESQDILEKEGIRRSLEEISRASLILFVADLNSLLEEKNYLGSGIRNVLKNNVNKALFVINKTENADSGTKNAAAAKLHDIIHTDLPLNEFLSKTVFASCITGDGIRELDDRIRKQIREAGAVFSDSVLLEDRHVYHLEKTAEALKTMLRLWEEGAPDEIAVTELDTALEHTGLITGRISNEEILGRIFSLFCIGK